MAGGTTRGRSCTLRYMTARQNPPPTRLKHASIYYPQWKSPTIMLLFVSAEKKPTNPTRPTSTMARLGQVSADTTPISGPRGGAHAMPCSGPQGGVPEPRLVFQTIVPVRSRDVASTRPPALGCCHPSHRTAAVQRHRIRDSMVRIVVQRHCRQGIMCRMKLRAKTKGRRHRDLSKHSTPSPPPPPKTPQKGGDNPIHTRSTNPHPETPMHNSPPQPPSYNLNPSARDTSEEYRPPIHKTTIYLPTQTPPVSLPCTTSTVRRKKSGNIPPPPHFFLP